MYIYVYACACIRHKGHKMPRPPQIIRLSKTNLCRLLQTYTCMVYIYTSKYTCVKIVYYILGKFFIATVMIKFLNIQWSLNSSKCDASCQCLLEFLVTCSITKWAQGVRWIRLVLLKVKMNLEPTRRILRAMDIYAIKLM